MCRTYDTATQTPGQGHASRSWDLPFCVRCISPEPFERFSLNFTLKVPLSETVSRTHNSAMQSEGQGIYHFVSAPYLQNSLKDFHQISLKMFLSVRWCAETMTQLCRQGQGHTSRSWDLPLTFMSVPYLFSI